MTGFTGAPSLVDEQDAFRGPYAARTAEFIEAGLASGLTPAAHDIERIAVVLVDYQHDFVDPTGALAVPGAQEDVARFLRWFYASTPRITSLYASLDTHIPYQIFFSSWWQNTQTGEHPQPFTPLSAAEVNAGQWTPLWQPDWSVYYVNKLAEQARKELMIWPHHTMQGTLGHMLVAPLSEAIAWHSAARGIQPVYVAKGLTIRSEFYGIFGAEVEDPDDPTSKLNLALLKAITQHDRVYIAGEAKSHCVLETARQLVAYLSHSERPDLLARLYILRDCTSSVQHPAVDFDALAEQELSHMQQLGVHLVNSHEILD